MSRSSNIYKYKKLGSYWRPLLPIGIKHGNEELYELALVDSGADNCVFHKDIADALGIDLSSAEEVELGGINSDEPIIGFIAEVSLGVQPYQGASSCYYYGDNIPVIFSDQVSDNGFAVLGQIGFFDNFDVRFSYQKKSVKITWNS
jgi:hypothetical protein